MMSIKRLVSALLPAFCCLALDAQEPDSLTVVADEVVVTGSSGRYSMSKVTNTQLISAAELKRAACCNLGESFTTNPSVDVSYNDAATGARQIKLLGLSGSYVQMLTENIPNLRIAAAPYGLGYIAGPWMQSIQVSKGTSSVKNGYESVTGQINIELKKPQLDQEYSANGYVDHIGKVEANADANWHLTESLSTGLLAHFENALENHDENGDGFLDMPRIRQVALMDRWAWLGTDYVFQAAVKYLDEKRTSGQDTHHSGEHLAAPYKIAIDTRRWEAFTKNAYIFDHENDGNIALILSGCSHDQDARFGDKLYSIDHRNLYASLMFERKWASYHALSTGLSYNLDHLRQNYSFGGGTPFKSNETEGVSGVYAQYTLDFDKKLLVMGGVRYDYSSVYGSMFTPRAHLRWSPIERISLHASAGRGYRSPHPLAENSYLLASSREIVIEDNLKQEDAWNYGTGLNLFLPIFSRTLNLSAEYYFTNFRHQIVIDFDTDPHKLYFRNLRGKSYSHTVQIEATYPIVSDLTATVAWRLNDVKCDYGRGLEQKPLVSRDKWLMTATYTPMMGIWQFDVTLAVNGSGRMPTPYALADGSESWSRRYKSFSQLSAQITRNFRHFALYIGGENLTGYRQPNPIIGSDDPYGPNFDSTMIYSPLHGAVGYIGFRYTFTRY